MGSRGAGSFLSRTTWILALLFCAISLTMAVVVSRTVVTPEEDLGVIGQSQSEAPAQQDITDGLPALDDSGQDSDLPVLDTANDVPPQGDIPQLDGEPETVADPDEGVSGEDPADGPGNG